MIYGGGPREIERIILPDYELVFNKVVEHKHVFKPRTTIKTVISYDVYFLPKDYSKDIIQVYRGARKSDANKMFKIAKKHGAEMFQKIVNGVGELAENIIKQA